MTPKEKAKDLVKSYKPHSIRPKKCALIAVDEILRNERLELPFNKRNQIYFCDIEYWQEVKQEIEKL